MALPTSAEAVRVAREVSRFVHHRSWRRRFPAGVGTLQFLDALPPHMAVFRGTFSFVSDATDPRFFGRPNRGSNRALGATESFPGRSGITCQHSLTEAALLRKQRLERILALEEPIRLLALARTKYVRSCGRYV